MAVTLILFPGSAPWLEDKTDEVEEEEEGKEDKEREDEDDDDNVEGHSVIILRHKFQSLTRKTLALIKVSYLRHRSR